MDGALKLRPLKKMPVFIIDKYWHFYLTSPQNGV